MTVDTTKKSYKETLNLPQTGFPMEAKLVQNEPPRLKKWQEAKLYEQVLAARADGKKWILHDGPPFANGDIHIGHVINKTLKDVILRFRTMQGYQTPYVPGWDCHGLPIEHKIQEQIKKEGKNYREVGVVEMRQRCFAYASQYAAVQSEQFQRLGILGDWARPYLTMSPGYEASTLEVFAKFVEAALVYKQLKPVPWSVANQTALADAELEYEDVTDLSVYIEFELVTPSSGTPGEGGGGGQKTKLADEGGGMTSEESNPSFISPPSSASGPLPNPPPEYRGREAIPTHLLVWTTTPWTLPANLAVAVAPKGEYSFVRYERDGQSRVGVIATNLVDLVFKDRLGVSSYEVVGSKLGEELLDLQYRHPFIERFGQVLPADYVTVAATEGEEPGTGLVHTAPGHGEEDYETGVKFKLEVYSPVLANGRFDDTTPEFIRGKTTKEGNALITAKLKEVGLLFAEVPIKHSYPHDWRSKTPIIFRATEQWFVAMDQAYAIAPSPGTPGEGWGGGQKAGMKDEGGRLKEKSSSLILPTSSFPAAGPLPNPPPGYRERGPLTPVSERTREDSDASAGAAAESGSSRSTAQTPASLRDRAERAAQHDVAFIPEWGRHRLEGMLKSRPDWCVSRQRAWGLPIPVFYNEQGEALLTPQSVRAVAERFAAKGSDAWFTDSPAELLDGCDTGSKFPKEKLRKETDIFDVWFESGSSWHAVLQARDDLAFPADLYLEGSDQHRGWFQLSLLPSLGATGRPPFKSVLTHGFVVKPDGKKVSKSDKEYVKAVDEINRHGADVLRLWCSSVDYQGDIPTSPKAIQEFGDKYRKIRNTLRYLLSNLYDFNPATDAQEVPLNSLDGWALSELDQVIAAATEAYDKYQLHRVFKLLHEFCTVQISAVYGNAMKDRLYCDVPSSPLRRRSQTVMHQMAVALTKLLAPICVYTADEAWEAIAHKVPEDSAAWSVHLAKLPEPLNLVVSDDQEREWKLLMELRSEALGQIDKLTRQIGKYKALDAEVIFKVDDAALKRQLEAYGPDLEDLVGCGYYSFAEKGTAGPAVVVEVLDRREVYKACARSWKRRPDVGADPEHPDLTLRDAAAVRARAESQS